MSIDDYRRKLRVNKHTLDDELEEQPDIMDRISRKVVELTTKANEAKDEVARTEGRLAEDVKEADPKLSLPATEAKVRRAPERIRDWQQYQQARALLEEWQGLLEAWKNKGYSIKTLSDLYAANYFSVNSTTMTERQKRRHDDDPSEARASLRRASTRSSDEAPSTTGRRRVLL